MQHSELYDIEKRVIEEVTMQWTADPKLSLITIVLLFDLILHWPH